MNETRLTAPLLAHGLFRAELTTIDSEHSARVTFEGDGSDPFECDILHAPVAAPALAPGDVVLVWRSEDQRGVILGRLGASSPDEATPQTEPPDELVLEARRSLTLRVGDGSITIREDGKILIKGKDLVSHAKRMNRIRGGSVTIN